MAEHGMAEYGIAEYGIAKYGIAKYGITRAQRYRSLVMRLCGDLHKKRFQII